MKKNLAQKIAAIAFGIIAGLLIIEAGLRLGGHVFSSRQERKNTASLSRKGAYRILCLGESTTALGGSSSWPSQLEDILNGSGSPAKFSVIDEGVPSINTSYIVGRLEENLDKYGPDMVITMMGMNDRDDTVIYGEFPLKTYKLAKLLVRNIYAKFAAMKKEKQERALVEAVKNSPGDADAWTRLGWYYESGNDFGKAEQAFEKAAGLNPSYEMTYFELARCYKEQGKYDDAAAAFEKILDVNPHNEMAYTELGRCYREQGKPEKAEQTFANALELDPRNVEFLIELGRCYMDEKKYGRAEQAFVKAMDMNAANDSVYFELGLSYEKQGEYGQAAAMFEKSIGINPRDPMNDKSYFELGRCYRALGGYGKAEKVIEKAAELNPADDRAYDELAELYDAMGNNAAASEARRKADDVRLTNVSPVTRNNYRELKRILDTRGIKLVCVQYPTRPVEPLRQIMKPYKDVVFVDNEGSFKDALSRGSYDEYFSDACYIDFGHCTPKGNRLLAQNIADTILKAYPNLR